MADGKKTIDDLIKEIVYNKDIHDLMTNPFRDILQFQDNACKGMIQDKTKRSRTSLEKEGFQVGEPFDGDIEQAPVLFLSSNPAFNFDEVSPRYHSASGKIFMPKHKDTITKKQVPAKGMSFVEVKDFFKNRIVNSPSTGNNDECLRISLKNGNTAAVSYWTCVRKNTELLLPAPLKSSWTNLNPSQRVREIMKYVVCMEIVPFRSNSEIGVNDKLLDKCWIDFTEHLLELPGAEAFVLVGNKALKVFVEKLKVPASDIHTLKNRGVIKQIIGNKSRLVVKVDFNQVMKLFVGFFNYNVISQLQKAVAASL